MKLSTFLICGLLAVPAVSQEPNIVGEITAIINGDRQSWESFDTDGRPGAMWTHQEPGVGRLSIGGFESSSEALRDPGWKGSQITVSFAFPLDASRVRHTLPAAGVEPASVHYIPVGGEYRTMLVMAEGFVEATIEMLSEAGDSRFEGTFAGRLVDDDGDVVATISDGRFSIHSAGLVKLDH